MKQLFLLICVLLLQGKNIAQPIHATPADYSAKVADLIAGDTLLLSPGIYSSQLKIFDLVGTPQSPIVIIGDGDATVFTGNACCNTVSIKMSAYVELHDFSIDGKSIPYIDAIKAEGTAGNWAHHMTIAGIHIIGHGGDQQTVGISTKCPTWDWVIKHCHIVGAGTGMYLGNSDGTAPFVNGLIEYNLVINTLGYNMQIKHQNVGSRNIPGMTLNGKTIIRHNVWSKSDNANSGGNARPNLLVGNFPASGDGANDVYEIYGNFFWQNPVESLFQGTGNISFYNNICLNHAGGGGISFQSHNGFQPRNIHVFHNTVISDQSWGIRLMDTDPAYQKYIYGNAVFSDHATPIRIVGSGINTALLSENVSAPMMNTNTFVHDGTSDLNTINVFPVLNSPLKGSIIPNDPFLTFTAFQHDFNGTDRDWTYRGAYHGDGNNPGWHLALEEKTLSGPPVHTDDQHPSHFFTIYPNPASHFIFLKTTDDAYWNPLHSLQLIDAHGRVIHTPQPDPSSGYLDLAGLPQGIYFIRIYTPERIWQSPLIIANGVE